ncbi:hypothetical protein [Microbulbifer sp. TYP-18]|uniref:hypothetical protein n=1 Tax=Microbulbifer sp. TYP-18 TaxID=3230024 RepID=UPI0034C64250
MKINIYLKLLPLSSLLIGNHAFSDGPPEVPFSILFLQGEYANSYPDNQIYANGRMQAEVDVFYELKDGYTFIGADLKELYNAQSFSNTVVSDGYNGYIKDVRLGPGVPSASLTSPSINSVARKYLSSSSEGIIQVCVEAQARNNNTNAIITQSTCEGTTNNASAVIEKLSPTNFSSSSFQKTETSIGWHHFSSWIDDWNILTYSFRPNNFTLRRVWDENGLQIDSTQLGRHGITYAPYRLIGSYQANPSYPDNENAARGTSSLYWIEKGVTTSFMEFPSFDGIAYHDGPTPYKKFSMNFNFNTNEDITFIGSFGGAFSRFAAIGASDQIVSRNIANMGWYYPGFPTGASFSTYLNDLEPTGKKVHFEDNFGNRGYFTFARANLWNDYFQDGYYNFQVSTGD